MIPLPLRLLFPLRLSLPYGFPLILRVLFSLRLLFYPMTIPVFGLGEMEGLGLG